jgi:hypothetical protein
MQRNSRDENDDVKAGKTGGDTAIVGGRLDDGGLGAAWVFAATGGR